MPIRVDWDNEAHTIIRYRLRDPWELVEYSQANHESWALIDSVDHIVHVIVDCTDVFYLPKNMLTAAATTNSEIHPRQGLIIGVKISPYLQTVVNVAARIFPRLGHNLYFVRTLDDAYKIIQDHEAKH